MKQNIIKYLVILAFAVTGGLLIGYSFAGKSGLPFDDTTGADETPLKNDEGPVVTDDQTPAQFDLDPHASALAAFRGNNGRTADYSVRGAQGPVEQRWRHESIGGINDQDSPTVANGKIFASDSEYFYAFDEETGREYWKLEMGFTGTAAATRDAVYFTDGNNLQARFAPTGQLIWQVELTGAIWSSPAVADGVVYICRDAGVSKPGSILALDAASGETRWSLDTPGPVRYSPAVADGVLYAGGTDGTLYAVDAVKGSIIWQHQAGGSIDSPPVVSGGLVYFGASRYVDNYLYGGTYQAVTVVDGSEVWRIETSLPTGYSLAAIGGGMVFLGGAGGDLAAYQADTGAELWRFRTGADYAFPPSYGSGEVYFSDGRQVYALDAATGAENWRYEIPVSGLSFHSSSIAIAQGSLYLVAALSPSRTALLALE